MKIRLLSDLHLEFSKYKYDHIFDPVREDAEDNAETILLLAGDIGINTGALPFIEKLCKHFKRVLYILGNHEFYNYEFRDVTEEWIYLSEYSTPDNFIFLNNEMIIIDDVRFIGGTMWTSFKNGDPFVMDAAQRMMNDFNKIKHNGRKLSTITIKNEHSAFMDMLFEEFKKQFSGKTVVMTHHSPGNAIQCRGKTDDLLDHCYYAELNQYIGNTDVASLWVHGHTHTSHDYAINNTRVVCNPLGYVGHSVNKNFNPNLIIKI